MEYKSFALKEHQAKRNDFEKVIQVVRGTQNPINTKMKIETFLFENKEKDQILKRSHSKEEVDGMFKTIKKEKDGSSAQACKIQRLEPTQTIPSTEKETEEFRNDSNTEKTNKRKNSKKSKRKNL